MNLIGDPWIPVALGDGSSQEIGLEELYRRASEIRDLALAPPQRIAVMRLLLCIVHAAIDGPEHEDDWKRCKKRIVPESLGYLENRSDCFHLYGERPFLQVTNLVPVDNATHDKLDFTLSAGNNHILFDHGASPQGRVLSDGQLALHLLAYQCLSPGGLVGETKWAGKKTGRSSESAPCMEGSPLLTILRGEDLIATIHANLLCKDQLHCPFGRPVWETAPETREGSSAKMVANSYLGRLVPLSRGVLLAGGSCALTLVNGLSYPKLPEGRDSMATVLVRGEGAKQEHKYLRIDPRQHPWRELASVLAYRRRQRDEAGGPPALRHLHTLDSEQFDLWVGGLAASQAKLLDSGEWVFTLPSGMIDHTALEAYSNGVERARRMQDALKFGVKVYCEDMKLQADGHRECAVVAYWSRLDATAGLLVRVATGAGASMSDWQRTTLHAARDAYSSACAQATPRQVQAFAKGMGALVGLAKKGGWANNGD